MPNVCALRAALPVAATLTLLSAPGYVAAQDDPAATYTDSNLLHPVADIEQRFLKQPFEVVNYRDTRFEGDRTQQVALEFPDGAVILAKWAEAVPGGDAFNNHPRYEAAAYEFQKLFLDSPDYVVPPTVMRCVDLDWYRGLNRRAKATFGGSDAVLIVLQYWLFGVTDEGVFDDDRLESDPAYARHLGHVNMLTYLIRHSDANLGNILISSDPSNPRLFSVDNGVAFGSEASDRGYEWRELRTDRLPAAAVDRLRGVTREVLDRSLGVVAQFEDHDGQLAIVEPTENLNPHRGVRERDGVIQLGLTADEIVQVESRIRNLLDLVDQGEITTF